MLWVKVILESNMTDKEAIAEARKKVSGFYEDRQVKETRFVRLLDGTQLLWVGF